MSSIAVNSVIIFVFVDPSDTIEHSEWLKKENNRKFNVDTIFSQIHKSPEMIGGKQLKLGDCHHDSYEITDRKKTLLTNEKRLC
jgi:hypothetical protein